MLKFSKHLIFIFLVVSIIACGNSKNNSYPHPSEAGTTPITSETSSLHGTYKLSKIYSGDLSILKAEGVQYLDANRQKIIIKLHINTLIDSYVIEREYPITFEESSFKLLHNTKERYVSENSSSRNSFLIHANYIAVMPEFNATLNIEWQKVSNTIKKI